MAEEGFEIRKSFDKNKEGISLWTGIILVLITAFFFAEKLGIITTGVNFTDETLLMFFAILCLVSAVIHIISTVGTKYD